MAPFKNPELLLYFEVSLQRFVLEDKVSINKHHLNNNRKGIKH